MTFKEIRIWSRSITYNEILSCIVRSREDRRFKDSYAYNSMLWLNLFTRDRPYNKIRDWMYALQMYKRYKTFK